MNELAVKRFNKAPDAGSTQPRDALETAIADLEKDEIKSVIIVAIDKNGDHSTYYSGPHVETLKKVWLAFQLEIMRVIERMVE